MTSTSERLTPLPASPPVTRSSPSGTLLLATVLGYVALVAAGYLALRWPGSLIRGNELSPTTALFMAINTATLTGFGPATPLLQYQPQGQVTVLLLMSGGSLLSLIVGGLAVTHIAGLPFSSGRVVRFAAGFYLAAVLGGTLLLIPGGHGGLEAVFLACSAVGNAGLVLRDLPGAGDWRTHGVLLPLAVLGGLGVPVLMDLFDRVRGRSPRLAAYSIAVLTLTSAIYLGGMALIALHPSPLDASAAVLNARTAGFPFHPLDQFPRQAVWVVMLIMIAGGAAGGTAGGVNVSTLAALGQGVQRTLAGRAVSTLFGVALLWVGFYLAMVTAAQLVMLHTEPQTPADRLLIEVVSAASNAGLSFGSITRVETGMHVLCLVMISGRVLPLALLVYLARKSRVQAAGRVTPP